MTVKEKVSDKILRFLQGQEEPQRAKIIATGIGANYGTVRNILRRLLKEGEIIQTKGGYLHPSVYISEIGAVYKELRIHGIKLEHRDQSKSYRIKTSPYLMLHANYTQHKHRMNGAVTLTEIWNNYKVTITIHRKELIEIWLNCNKTGLTIMEFYGFSQWVGGLFPKILQCQWLVKQYGLNVDYPRIQLDGIESLTLTMFEKSLLRIYNKNKEKLRVEFHGNVPITMDQAILLLSNMIQQTKSIIIKENGIGER